MLRACLVTSVAFGTCPGSPCVSVMFSSYPRFEIGFDVCLVRLLVDLSLPLSPHLVLLTPLEYN